MLLLSTRGRRTGLVRTMPLAYLPDPIEEDSFVVVASNGGSERPPALWLNLQATEIATAQVGRKSFWVRAEIVPPSRRSSLWVDLQRKLPPGPPTDLSHCRFARLLLLLRHIETLLGLLRTP